MAAHRSKILAVDDAPANLKLLSNVLRADYELALATGRDDHLGGDIVPAMFKQHANSTHDDILFAPHKTPNFNLRQVRMRRGDQHEILIENFRPSRYMMDALRL